MAEEEEKQEQEDENKLIRPRERARGQKFHMNRNTMVYINTMVLRKSSKLISTAGLN